MASTFINFVSEKLIHTQKNHEDGRIFYSISIPCSQSKTCYGTIAVSEKQILPATRRDGTVVPGFKNVLLGDPDRTRKLSIAKTKKTYVTVDMPNHPFAAMFDQAREAYRAKAAAVES